MSLAHSLYTLVLAIAVIIIGAGLGRVILRRFSICTDLDPLEAVVCSFGLGLGAIGIIVYLLGVAGAFRPLPIAGILVLGAIISAPGIADVRQDAARAVSSLAADWKNAHGAFVVLLGIAMMIAILALFLALAPPWAYDGLMYHLQAPRIFLEQGRVIPLPTNLQANGPMLGQMIFAIGLALGTDTFSQVLHLAYTMALVAAVLGAGRRWLGAAGGWIAAGILLGIPIVPLWGTLAYVDMLQAFYEFMAIWAILRWNETPRPAWLGLAAVMAGLAIGTKLMALFLVPPLCLWLILLGRRRGWLRAFGTALAFGLGVAAVGLVWYAFNAIRLGDPFFPFLRGGAEWPAARLALLVDYLRSFGMGRSAIDFFLLPWNLYVRHEAFAALMQSIEFPSFLFPLVLLAPIVVVSAPLRPLAILSLLRLATWFVGSQQTRFLLPLYPVWCLLTAGVLLGLEARLRLRPAPPRLSAGVIGGLVVTTLVYCAIFFVDMAPLPAVLGTGSRASFLERKVYDYRALAYLSSRIPGDAKVLQLWDGQSYYCDGRCIPDAGQVFAPFLHARAPTNGQMTEELAARDASYVLVDLESLNFLLRHDPRGAHRAAGAFFLRDYLPTCGDLEYADERVQIYRLTCSAESTAP